MPPPSADRVAKCDYEFPPPEKEKHDATAHAGGILSGEVTDTEHEVRDVHYSVHVKRGASPDHPRTLRVDYQLGFNQYQSEWVCIEHTGYARQKAEAWWRMRSNDPCPTIVDEAVERAEAGSLTPTHAITVRSVSGEKFDRIVNYQIDAKPPAATVGDLAGGEPDYIAIPDAEVPF